MARESSHRELQLSYSPLTALSRWTKVDPLNSARALNMASGAPGLAPGTLNVTRDTPTNDWAVSCVKRGEKESKRHHGSTEQQKNNRTHLSTYPVGIRNSHS